MIDGLGGTGDRGLGPDIERPSLLYVATVSPTIRQFLRPYAAYFRTLGWRVDAAANRASADEDLVEAFDTVYDLPLSRSILDIGGLVRSARAIEQILEDRPQLVHVHTPIAGFVTRLAVRRTPAARRPAVVYTAHGFHFHGAGHAATNALFLAAERLAGRWTDRLVVINDEDEAAAERHRIVPKGHLLRLPGVGIDLMWYSRSALPREEIARAREALAVAANAPLFVVLGELNQNKRPSDVIAALGAVSHKDTIVAFVGDGPYRARIEAAAVQAGLRNRIRLAGFVDDPRPMLAAATALVLPSKREGLSRSIMEALALKVPVIASSARGNRELVADSGFIVPVGDIKNLARAMDWLVDHPHEASAMGVRGRARMEERYDVGALIERHHRLYADLLEERASDPRRVGST